MAGEDEGDAHTLGLLVDLRDLRTKIGVEYRHMTSELHDLLRQVQTRTCTVSMHAFGEGRAHRRELRAG